MAVSSVPRSGSPTTAVAIPGSSASSSQPAPKNASLMQRLLPRSESSRDLVSSSFVQNLRAVSVRSQEKPLKALQRSVSARDLLFDEMKKTVGALTDRCAQLEVELYSL